MTAGADGDHTGDDDKVIFVVITPTGELRQICADGRSDSFPDDPYQAALWEAVHGAVAAPGSNAAVTGLEVPGQDLRAKVIDAIEAHKHPALYRPNPVASAVLFILGLRLPRSVFGAVAITREEDPETGRTGSLDADQLKAITRAYNTVIDRLEGAANWRYS